MTLLKQQVKKHYKVRDLGPISYYLSVKVTRDRAARILTLSMPAYIDRLIDKYHLSNAHSRKQPLPRTVLNFHRSTEPAEKSLLDEYQSLLGKLLYPTLMCRPDCAWAVGYMARYANNPTKEQLSSLKDIVLYLKQTRNYGIKYRRSNSQVASSGENQNDSRYRGISAISSSDLHCYTDAAFSDNLERKSSAGYVVMMAGGPVSYKAFKQRLVTASTTEAEFISMTYGAKEAY
jgi:hypothetical protein